MSAAVCFRPDGSEASLVFSMQPGSYNDESIMEFLTELHRHLDGDKVTLVWAHSPCSTGQRGIVPWGGLKGEIGDLAEMLLGPGGTMRIDCRNRSKYGSDTGGLLHFDSWWLQTTIDGLGGQDFITAPDSLAPGTALSSGTGSLCWLARVF